MKEFNILYFSGANEGDSGAFKGMEFHALSSGAKPVVSWLCRDGIQVCREACGGHGYLHGNFIVI